MATAAKLAANRANAGLSTGPADTSRTRFNGVAHGLTSKQTVIRGEDQQEFDTFSANMLRDMAPGSAVESFLAERIVAAAWRLKRFSRVESAFVKERVDKFLEENPHSNPDSAVATLFTDPAEMVRMRLFLRYQTSVQREYDIAVRELQKAKDERIRKSSENAYVALVHNTPAREDRRLESAFGFASQNASDSDTPQLAMAAMASTTASSGQPPARYTGL